MSPSASVIVLVKNNKSGLFQRYFVLPHLLTDTLTCALQGPWVVPKPFLSVKSFKIPNWFCFCPSKMNKLAAARDPFIPRKPPICIKH